MPDLRGKTLADAQKKVGKSLRLSVKGCDYHDVTNDQPKDRIYLQDPQCPAKRPWGSWISIWLSKGPKPEPAQVKVPDFTGKTRDEAFGLAEENQLRPEVTLPDWHATIPRDLVCGQDVRPGGRVSPGTTVRLTLSKGSYIPPPPPVGPATITWYGAEARPLPQGLSYYLDGRKIEDVKYDLDRGEYSFELPPTVLPAGTKKEITVKWALSRSADQPLYKPYEVDAGFLGKRCRVSAPVPSAARVESVTILGCTTTAAIEPGTSPIRPGAPQALTGVLDGGYESERMAGFTGLSSHTRLVPRCDDPRSTGWFGVWHHYASKGIWVQLREVGIRNWCAERIRLVAPEAGDVGGAKVGLNRRETHRLLGRPDTIPRLDFLASNANQFGKFIEEAGAIAEILTERPDETYLNGGIRVRYEGDGDNASVKWIDIVRPTAFLLHPPGTPSDVSPVLGCTYAVKRGRPGPELEIMVPGGTVLKIGGKLQVCVVYADNANMTQLLRSVGVIATTRRFDANSRSYVAEIRDEDVPRMPDPASGQVVVRVFVPERK